MARRLRWAVVLAVVPVLCLNALAGWALVAHEHDDQGLHVHAQRGGAERACHRDHAPPQDAPGDDEPHEVRVELPAHKPLPSKKEAPRLASVALPVAILTAAAGGHGLPLRPVFASPDWSRSAPSGAVARLVRTSCALLL